MADLDWGTKASDCRVTPTLIDETIVSVRFDDGAMWIEYERTGWVRAEDAIDKSHPDWLRFAKGFGNG